LQIVGKPFGDAEVLRIGHALEGALALTSRRPPLFSTGAA
jgi:Asp-tRNA(Asn)/Glu-tRNA(Gln) amidotransferase A subunit family amidase